MGTYGLHDAANRRTFKTFRLQVAEKKSAEGTLTHPVVASVLSKAHQKKGRRPFFYHFLPEATDRNHPTSVDYSN